MNEQYKVFDNRDRNSSDNFQSWMESNTGKFFINYVSSNDLMLHKVPCSHFVFRKAVDLAAHKKICSSNRQELEKWAENNSKIKLRICSTCKP